MPRIPPDFDLYFLLPWIGFYLAGAAGIMWFSYWVHAHGYAGDTNNRSAAGSNPAQNLKEWLTKMSATAAIGAVGGSLITIAFLILGAEVLGPQSIVPSGDHVAAELMRLFSSLWGTAGQWLLAVTLFVALWGTVINNQDGWGRLLADATTKLRSESRETPPSGSRLARLKTRYILGVGMAAPMLLAWLVPRPVEVLSAGGIIAGAHTPLIVFVTLYLNRKRLPRDVRPGVFLTSSMVLAGVFFMAFAALYFLDLAGIRFSNAGEAGA